MSKTPQRPKLLTEAFAEIVRWSDAGNGRIVTAALLVWAEAHPRSALHRVMDWKADPHRVIDWTPTPLEQLKTLIEAVPDDVSAAVRTKRAA